MVEQLAVNQRVVGSSPTSGANLFLVYFLGNRSGFRLPHFNCQQNCQQICALWATMAEQDSTKTNG